MHSLGGLANLELSSKAIQVSTAVDNATDLKVVQISTDAFRHVFLNLLAVLTQHAANTTLSVLANVKTPESALAEQANLHEVQFCLNCASAQLPTSLTEFLKRVCSRETSTQVL